MAQANQPHTASRDLPVIRGQSLATPINPTADSDRQAVKRDAAHPKALLASVHQSHGLLSMASYAVREDLADVRVCTYIKNWRTLAKAQRQLDPKFEVQSPPEDIKKLLSPKLLSQLRKWQPDFFGLSVQSEDVALARNVIRYVRSILPNVRVFIGGPAAILSPAAMAIHTDADFVYPGEADFAFGHAVDALARLPLPEAQTKLKRLGFYRRDFNSDGRPVVVKPDLDLIPRLDEEAMRDIRVDWSLYAGEWIPNVVTISSSRGCHFGCPYCAKTMGNEFRAWSPEKILEAIADISAQKRAGIIPKKVDQIDFGDDDFVQDRDRAIRFFELFAESSYSNEFQLLMMGSPASFFRGGQFDHELLSVMCKANFAIAFGIESLCPQGLKDLKQPHTMEMLEQLIYEFDKAGIDQKNFIILFTSATTATTIAELACNLFDYVKRYGPIFNYRRSEQVFPGKRGEARVKSLEESGLRLPEPRVISEAAGHGELSTYAAIDLLPGTLPGVDIYSNVVGEIAKYLDGETPNHFMVPWTILRVIRERGERVVTSEMRNFLPEHCADDYENALELAHAKLPEIEATPEIAKVLRKRKGRDLTSLAQ